MSVADEIAVVDVETTGLFPGGVDRVVEIGIVRMTAGGHVLDEYTTLINPERDIGPTHIHQIHAGDVLDAPRFGDVLGDICFRLRGAYVGGHNVEFDARFLEAEFTRAGHVLPVLKLLCSMRALGGSLDGCCRDFQLEPGAHTALHDARASARLLAAWLADLDPDQTLDSLATEFQGSGSIWPQLAASGRCLGRREAAAIRADKNTYLARLVERLPTATGIGSPHALATYCCLLDRVLEDRRIDDLERAEIDRLTREWGLTREQASEAHRDYMRRLVAQALADGVLSDGERSDLQAVAERLGIEKQVLDTLLASAAPTAVSSPAGPRTLAGKSVCFTGELSCTIDGRTITRAKAEDLATQAGLIVLRGVTKKLDILVLADPDTQSGKAKKARTYGTRLMGEMVFWAELGVAVD